VGSTAPQNVKIEHHTITSSEFSAKKFTLDGSPQTTIMCDYLSGGTSVIKIQDTDFELLNQNEFSWNALGLDGTIGIGDIIRAMYFV